MSQSHSQSGQPDPTTDKPFGATTDCGRAEAREEQPTDPGSPTFQEVLQAAQEAFSYKKEEIWSTIDVAAAHTNLVKKSLLVTILATLAAFTLSCCTWLILNAALVISLHNTGMSLLIIVAACGLLNGALALVCYRIARDAYRCMNFMPLIKSLTQRQPQQD